MNRSTAQTSRNRNNITALSEYFGIKEAGAGSLRARGEQTQEACAAAAVDTVQAFTAREPYYHAYQIHSAYAARPLYNKHLKSKSGRSRRRGEP